jgi:hypothetical protein
MAPAVMAWMRHSPSEGPARSRTGPWRHFFAALAAFYAAVALAGFLPSYLRFRAGALDLSWAAHVHGALMAGWLALLVTQAWLPAAGRLDVHRRLGAATSAFAAIIWVSMIAVALRQIAVAAPPKGHFLFNILLLQIQAILLFPLFFAWAVAVRRRPGWHKRLMVITMIVPLGAAVDRMAWLPVGGVEGQWPYFLYLDLLIVPLAVFDLVSIRRLHPATVTGGGLLLASQLAVTLLWGTAAWQEFAYSATSLLR